jgi:subtilisin
MPLQASDPSPALLPARVIRLAHSSVGAPYDAARVALPCRVSREWAFGSASGAGVRVCLIDSGVDATVPALAGRVTTLTVVTEDADGREEHQVVPDAEGDPVGHGTACAGIIRSFAPECELTSIRVLGHALQGSGSVLLAALQWAVDAGFDVINLSLSTRRIEYKEALHDLADEAYHRGITIVASAHNRQVRSYPWHFASVISVGSHDRPDPEYLEANPAPPVEFFAHGVAVDMLQPGGGSARASGNSYATPHVTGMCARILGAHPSFGSGQLKQALTAIANNTTNARLA